MFMVVKEKLSLAHSATQIYFPALRVFSLSFVLVI